MKCNDSEMSFSNDANRFLPQMLIKKLQMELQLLICLLVYIYKAVWSKDNSHLKDLNQYYVRRKFDLFSECCILV